MIRVLLAIIIGSLMDMFADASFPHIGPLGPPMGIGHPMIGPHMGPFLMPHPFPPHLMRLPLPGIARPMMFPWKFPPKHLLLRKFRPPPMPIPPPGMFHAKAKAAEHARIKNHMADKRRRLLLIRRKDKYLHNNLKKATSGVTGLKRPIPMPIKIVPLAPGSKRKPPPPPGMMGKLNSPNIMRPRRRFSPGMRRGGTFSRMGDINMYPDVMVDSSLPPLREALEPAGNRVSTSRRGPNHRGMNRGPGALGGPRKVPMDIPGPLNPPMDIASGRVQSMDGRGRGNTPMNIRGPINDFSSRGNSLTEKPFAGPADIVGGLPGEITATRENLNLAPYSVDPIVSPANPNPTNNIVDLTHVDVQPLPPMSSVPARQNGVDPIPPVTNPLGGTFIDLTSINPADALGNMLQDAGSERPLIQDVGTGTVGSLVPSTDLTIGGSSLETVNIQPPSPEVVPIHPPAADHQSVVPAGHVIGVDASAGHPAAVNTAVAHAEHAPVVETVAAPAPVAAVDLAAASSNGAIQSADKTALALEGIDPALLNGDVLVIDTLGGASDLAGSPSSISAGGNMGQVDVVTLDNAAYSKLEQAIASGQAIDAQLLDSIIGGGAAGQQSIGGTGVGVPSEVYIVDIPHAEPGSGSRSSTHGRQVSIPQAHNVIGQSSHGGGGQRGHGHGRHGGHGPQGGGHGAQSGDHGGPGGHNIGTVGEPVGSIAMGNNMGNNEIVGLFSVPKGQSQMPDVPASVSSIPKSIGARMGGNASRGHSSH